LLDGGVGLEKLANFLGELFVKFLRFLATSRRPFLCIEHGPEISPRESVKDFRLLGSTASQRCCGLCMLMCLNARTGLSMRFAVRQARLTIFCQSDSKTCGLRTPCNCEKIVTQLMREPRTCRSLPDQSPNRGQDFYAASQIHTSRRSCLVRIQSQQHPAQQLSDEYSGHACYFFQGKSQKSINLP
jgi:hypothetical protein